MYNLYQYKIQVYKYIIYILYIIMIIMSFNIASDKIK